MRGVTIVHYIRVVHGIYKGVRTSVRIVYGCRVALRMSFGSVLLFAMMDKVMKGIQRNFCGV